MNFSQKNGKTYSIPSILNDLGKMFADDFQVKFNENYNSQKDCNNMKNDWKDTLKKEFAKEFSNEFATRKTTHKSMPAVNIHETENTFELAVIAPGLKKADFKLSIEDNILKISSDISSEMNDKHNENDKENTERPTENAENVEEKHKNSFSRTEFVQRKFSRSFELPESIDTEIISAKYDAGILRITLPKKVQTNETKVRKVEIA